MSRFEVERIVQAPKTIAWDIISDVIGYAEIAPNLSKIEHLHGNGQGMMRRCYDMKNRGWDETCTMWQEGQEYTMEVNTSASDYPYPFAKLRGTWKVEEITKDVSKIIMTFDYEMKNGLIAKIAEKAVKFQSRKLTQELLDNMEKKIAERLQLERIRSQSYNQNQVQYQKSKMSS